MGDLAEYSAGPVVTSVIEFYSKRHAPAPARLDGSTVGGPCGRALWYAFRFCGETKPDGIAERRADIELRAKDCFLFELREIGVEAFERIPETGKRFEFSDCAGHLGAAMDAATHKVPSGGDQWHVTEFAMLDPDVYVRAKDKGVREACGEQFDKLQLLMGWSGMKRALFMGESRFSSELYAERVPFDPVYFERLRGRAESIIFATEAPPRAYNDPTEDECRACPSAIACHGTRPPAISCRTCCYSTPERDGDAVWSCCHPAEPRAAIAIEDQRTGCPNHLYMPFMINYAEVVEASADGWMVFKRKDNGRHFVVASATTMPPADMFAAYEAPALYHSGELAAAIDDRMIGNAEVEKVKMLFDGRVVG
jgi:hypothetical protein